MRVGRSSSSALIAALAIVLGACAGESPTSPSNPGGGTPPGPCSTSITLAATTVTPLAGTGIVVRATVTQGGVAVPDGTSVLFTVDFGFFGETGLPSVSKVTQNGFADVTLGALSSGLAKLKATRDCATASLNVEFQPVPVSGPFISTVEPSSGSCVGGDTVVINGGRFVPANPVNTLEYRVLFGGARASVLGVSDTQITVKTPARTLANAQVPETVDVTVAIVDGPVADTVTLAKGFTYYCVDPSKRMTVSSLAPTFGFADGGDTVRISGNNFLPTPAGAGSPGSSIVTTQVTFGGLPASVSTVTNSEITVQTPRRVLADPTKGERVDVSITIDLGLPSKQSAIMPQAYQYLPTFAGGACNSNPLLSIASVVPADPATAGRPDGGDVVSINGIGFFAGYATLPTNRVRVEFGGIAAVVTSLSDTVITVSTPRRTLANPQVSETVDVTVYVDLGGPRQSCAKATSAFTYRGTGAGTCTTSPNVFITSVVPTDPVNAGKPDGGDEVTINGGGFFVGYPSLPASAVRVEFGGVPATVTQVSNTSILVTTPKRVLANPQVPETVDVNVIVDVGGPKQTCAKAPGAFTYRGSGATTTCNTNPKLYISSVLAADPVNAGSPDGGDVVTITGGGFFAEYSTLPASRVRVEVGGIPAVVTVLSDTSIGITTPRRVLANPQVPETVDVVVTVDVGGPRQGCAKALSAFTYRGSGPAAPCGSNPNLFISSVVPVDPVNAGNPDGGDVVTITGGGFFAGYSSLPANRVRVEVGGIPAVVTTLSDTSIGITTPRRVLANPLVPEAVDIVVTVDVGGARQGCAKALSAFTYRGLGPSAPCGSNPNLFISSVVPTDPVNAGNPDGGDAVTINGGGFFAGYVSMPIGRVRVEVGGIPAVVTSVTSSAIGITTPRRILADPNVPETVDVVVTVDVGGAKQGCAKATSSFTYRAIGPNAPCNTRKDLFISAVEPGLGATGTPDGGERVTISGGGFFVGYTTLPANRVRVDFGGQPAIVTAVTNTTVTVQTPRRVLANPDKPETVEVVVTVDVGGPKQACARAANAFTYYPGASVDPVITSMSPNAGPNDASVRVTIFGRNFAFPSQVFVAGVEATVVSVTANEIVFMTPTAIGPNSQLANGLREVQVVDTRSGRRSAPNPSYRYYGCPSVNGLSPSVGLWNQATIVTVAGQNFEEPIEATFDSTVTGLTRLDVISVTPSMVLVRMPALDAAHLQLGPTCTSVTGTIQLTFLTLPSGQCPPVTASFTYKVDPPTIQSLSPNSVPQEGGATITVAGAFYSSSMTVEIFNGSTVLARLSTATVNAGTLTFTAPPMPSSAFGTETCQASSGTIGRRLVTTEFAIRIIDDKTGCSTTAFGLYYVPADTSCHTAVTIGASTAPSATLCSAYGPFTVPLSGGTSPFTFTASGLPAGLRIDPASGAITGTPELTATGVGVASTTATFTVNVTDSSQPAQAASKTYSITLLDPNAPFAVTGSPQQTIPATGGVGSLLSVSPSPTPTGFNPINWTMSIASGSVPTPPLGSISLTNTTGPSTAITVLGSVPANTYTITVTATDSSCGSFRHVATFQVLLTKGAPIDPIITNNAGAITAGALCQPYAPYTFSAIGGTPPYRWAVSSGSLPTGLTLDPLTGVVSGRPRLPIAGNAPVQGGNTPFPGTANTTVQFEITVTDSSTPPIPTPRPGSTKTFSIGVSDPNAPFSISGQASQVVGAVGGPTGSSLTAIPDPTPAAPWSFAPVSWRFDDLTLATQGWALTAATGQQTQIVVPASIAAGDYDIVVVAEDSSCDAAPHIATFTVRVTKRP